MSLICHPSSCNLLLLGEKKTFSRLLTEDFFWQICVALTMWGWGCEDVYVRERKRERECVCNRMCLFDKVWACERKRESMCWCVCVLICVCVCVRVCACMCESQALMTRKMFPTLLYTHFQQQEQQHQRQQHQHQQHIC